MGEPRQVYRATLDEELDVGVELRLYLRRRLLDGVPYKTYKLKPLKIRGEAGSIKTNHI